MHGVGLLFTVGFAIAKPSLFAVNSQCARIALVAKSGFSSDVTTLAFLLGGLLLVLITTIASFKLLKFTDIYGHLQSFVAACF